jgi:DNA-binding GntR family transcriptional regulator
MGEHSEVLRFLRDGDADNTAKVLRDHVAVQGEKFHQLIASLER